MINAYAVEGNIKFPQKPANDVASINWDQMLTETDDINVPVNHRASIFSLIIDKHAPLCEMRVSEKYCHLIDRDLKDLMRQEIS